MELSAKSLRAAHLFTRLEMLLAKHRDGFDCVVCCFGGRSLMAAFRENVEALKLLENERETLKKRWGLDKKTEARMNERRMSLLYKEFPVEKLEEFWKDFFEMIREENLNPDDFISFCRNYFDNNPHALGDNCHFASSGWEGRLYTAAPGARARKT